MFKKVKKIQLSTTKKIQCFEILRGKVLLCKRKVLFFLVLWRVHLPSIIYYYYYLLFIDGDQYFMECFFRHFPHFFSHNHQMSTSHSFMGSVRIFF